jgi:aladin
MGAVLLVTTKGSGGQVLAVHLPQGAPSLVAQLLPLDLPQLTSTAGGGEKASGGGGGGSKSSGGTSSGGGSGGVGAVAARAVDIVGMSWDPSGRRLAVVLDSAGVGTAAEGAAGGNSEDDVPHSPGRVVLYAVRMSPVVSASLLGYVSADDGRGGDGGSAAAGVVGGSGGPARWGCTGRIQCTHSLT